MTVYYAAELFSFRQESVFVLDIDGKPQFQYTKTGTTTLLNEIVFSDIRLIVIHKSVKGDVSLVFRFLKSD